MTPKPPISKPPINSQEPLPLNAVMRGGLRNRVRLFSDGASNILVPKGGSSTSKRTSITPPGAVGNIPVCVPVDISSIAASPASNPYNIGDVITFSAGGLVGTNPITYIWLLNGGAPVATTPTYVLTLADANIVGKDGSGLGHFTIVLSVANACGTDFISHNYPAQGTP